MGVHGLWDLLAPVGRRVSVETLAGKRVAIDASIWMIQFMKAMRDERGEMVRNAHLLGFFRRICKLLFLRTKPVFVFDGGTPALKRRTVIARRRQRENAQAKIRKTAEKLLFNHVKAMRLKELADNIQNQKVNNNMKGKEVMCDQSNTLEKNKAALEGHNQEMIDEMLAASILAEESGEIGTASCCAAEIGSSSGNASTSAEAFPKEEEDDEDDEEMILPITDGEVDPAVLAALPPSMQLDLLVQMRERLMAENRQKYQRVKKAPQKFSELQIEAYLKTVAFRREIDQVQKAASGKGVGGVQTSRIASESNREFIFSSSFSGDKRLLASSGADKIPEQQQKLEKKNFPSDFLNVVAAATKSKTEVRSDVDEAVQTFVDERGHRRISRSRAMGIRMTRDLQRNIDLLKELEQERTTDGTEANAVNPDIEVHSEKSLCMGKSFESVNEFNCMQNNEMNLSLEPEILKDTLKGETCILISFDDDGKQSSLDGDDGFFASLVASDQVPICSADNATSDCEWEDGTIDGNNLETNSPHVQDENNDDCDVEWEEGGLINDKSNMKSFDMEGGNFKEIGMKSQEPLAEIHELAPLFPGDFQKTVSKGAAEEADALQEAIRRSLEDLTGDGKQNSQSNFVECVQSSSSLTHLTSTKSAAVSSVPSMATKDLQEQQLITGIGTGLNSDLECCSSALTDMAAGILNDMVPKNCTDDMANDEASPMCTSSDICSVGMQERSHEYSVRQAADGLEEQPLHGNFRNTEGKDDIFSVGLQERSNDVDYFASNGKDNTLEPLGSTLEDELLVLDEEHKNLGVEQRKLERNADSVNAEMFVECQELLQMFGLPYIIAPMEAEAQCAYMELTNLVDGVVTDDSDVFLFGAQTVYKNIFDDRKYVETYLMKDIESELGLNREKLIRMALLLGSDYTEGVSGIGIVNAIEVINAFPEEEGLKEFREWIESPDPAILGKLGVQPGPSSKKKGSKASKKEMNYSKSDMIGSSAADSNMVLENEDNEARNGVLNIKLAFMNKHRNVSKNWHIPTSFPSDTVISAYAAPQVDKSTEPFAWGKPDIFTLRRLCWEKFGWANQKADELLLPVLKEYNKHETQLRLEAFYSFNERFAKIRSKRIKKAVKGITGKLSLGLDDADDLQDNPSKNKSEACANGKRRNKSLSKNRDHVGERMNSPNSLKLQHKGSQKEGPSTEVGSTGLCIKAEEQGLSNARRGSVKNKWSGTAGGISKQKDSSDSELNETSIRKYSSSSDELEHELLAQNIVLPTSVRRSKRARKAANYLEEDEENDELVIPFNCTSNKCSKDISDQQKSSHCPSVDGVDAVDDNEKQFTSEDLPEQALPGDYLVKGGGFCSDEDDTATIDANHQMAGGFCVDEEDDLYFRECDSVGVSTVTPATFSETEEADLTVDPSESLAAPASVPDIVQGLPKGLLPDSEQNLGVQHENTDVNLLTVAPTNKSDVPTSVNPFSAIPYLKRKRRKTGS